MAIQYSIQKMVSDGTLSTIALGIQYLQRNDIYIRIAGEDTPQSGAHSGYTWSFLDNTTLKILPVVPNGVEVVVYRRTGVDAMYNVYSQNAQFDEATIDENNQQLLCIAQEYFEQGVPAQLIEGVEYVREDAVNMYYRLKLSDGSYTTEFPMPKCGLVGFQQTGAGSVPRTSLSKMRETVSVQDFGGDVGSPDNSAALVAAQAESEVVQLPRGSYNIGTTQPDFNLAGGGKVVANGLTTGPDEISYNPARESVFYAPETYQREVQGINYPPPRGPDYVSSSYNFVMSLGSKLNDITKTIRYVTAFGGLNGCAPIEWGYTDVFGGNALAYAARSDRNVVVGSESAAWLGATDVNWLRTYQHDWWRKPPSNPYEPGELGWDSDGLETQFPGIGARIAAYAAYPTTSDQCAYNAMLGRDAGNHLVKGIRNVFVGYRSGAQMFAGDYNVGVGTQTLEHIVFGDRNTALGDKAGYSALDSFGTVFIGYGAGRTLENASESIVIGNLAAGTHKSAIKSIIIGSAAATGVPAGQLDNVLYLGQTATIPLLSGDFTTANAGVNIQPKKIRARQHIRYADSGSVLAPRPGLLVEGSSSSNMTIEANETGFGTLAFATPSNILIGGMQYNNGTNNLDIITNGVAQVRLESGTCFRPNADNNQALGRTAFRWSTVYAGTGTINTSDAREKTAPLAIDDAVLDAWADVQFVTFQWLESIRLKGDEARWHFGVIAQQVRDSFLKHDLDGTRYGLLCYDEWEDQFEQVIGDDGEPTGEMKLVVQAGNRWGIRADQCLFLEAAYQRRRCDRIEARLAAIGA